MRIGRTFIEKFPIVISPSGLPKFEIKEKEEPCKASRWERK